MFVYRYEFQKDNKRIGILTGLDEFFTENDIFSVCGVFEMDLELPPISMKDTKSFFTEKGNRKFRKSIRKIEKLANKYNISFITIKMNKEDLVDILYEDNYQIVILSDDCFNINACVA